MPKNEIDWGKPVEAKFGEGEWAKCHVFETELEGTRPIVVGIFVPGGPVGIPTVFAMPDVANYGAWQFRNVPPAPVPFEFTHSWANVYRRQDGTFYAGCLYATEQMARGCGETKQPHTTVPVTIRGEWRENGNG